MAVIGLGLGLLMAFGVTIPALALVIYVAIFIGLILYWLFISGQRYGFLTGFIAVYLFGAILLALWEIQDNLPPDNNYNGFKSLKPKIQLEIVEQLTLDNLADLHNAQDAITRWQAPGGVSQVTQNDKQIIQRGLLLAGQLRAGTVSGGTNVVLQGISTNITKLITNNFAISNWSGKEGMFSTLMLTQVSSTVTTSGNVSVTNKASVTTNTQPSALPMSGDLRLITMGQLRDASAQLAAAISMLERRYTFLTTNSMKTPPDVIAWLYNTNSAPLTPSENLSLPARVQNASVISGQFGVSQFNLFIVFMAFGVLGACAKCLASLARYLGVQRFKASWTGYYFFHPLIGGLLALAFYLVFKSGINSALLTPSTPNTPTLTLDMFGYCALAMLVGMFSDEATVKLEKVAGALLTSNTSKDDDEDADEISIQAVRVTGQPNLTAANITDLPGLAASFKAQLPVAAGSMTLAGVKRTEDLSRYLVSGFSPATQSLLTNYTSGINSQLLNALIEELNQAIKTKLLYQAPIFTSVTSPAVAKLQKLAYGTATMPTSGPVLFGIQQLNRWLLAWAYASEVACWVITLQGHRLGPATIVSLDGQTLPDDVIPTFDNGRIQFDLKFSDHVPGIAVLTVSNPAPNNAQSNEFNVSLN